MQQVPPLPRSEDFSLRATNPRLGGINGDKLTTTYDLVEQMQYLYVRVVKAKDLPAKDASGGCNPYVEVKLGNYKGTTSHLEKNANPEWNQVFAFSKERMQASLVDVAVKDKGSGKDDFVGRIWFDLNEVPKRVPPDSPLAPEWCMLENGKGEKIKGELMLAVWMGTQADEAFPDAWHSDAATVPSEGLASIRSKVYVTPKLWYVRVNVIEAQDLMPNVKGRFPQVFVKVVLGNQALKTRAFEMRGMNPIWNEDLMFVAAEPFQELLVLSVEDRIEANKDELLGKTIISLHTVDRRLDYRAVNTKWYTLEKNVVIMEGDKKKEVKFASRIHLRICLDGGYHVLDESAHYSSDLRPTAKQLWKPSIGVLQMGILSAQGLLPMKTKNGKGTTDAYCVAKYGQKWVRTRTIIDSFMPKWNEQYTWEVYDPCTVITVGVFDNCHLQGGEKSASNNNKDTQIGKVRIRLSTLEADKVYTHSYPLLVLLPSGLKKMGEVQLAVRFTCSSLINVMHMYTQPLLPKMHYLHPLTFTQLDNLRRQATQIVSMRLSRAEPPLRKEVVEYMLDLGSHMWSMRKSKANFFRIVGILTGLIAASRWFDHVCNWKSTILTVLIHFLFFFCLLYPEIILPTSFFLLFVRGVWLYRRRPRHPLHMDTVLSQAENATLDELDEEFDSFPTSRHPDVVRMRYDRLRSVASRVQTVVGDLASQGERLQSLLSWRDTRATALFLVFCIVACIGLWMTPFRLVVLLNGVYVLRHPRFRHRVPSVPLNFFRRLPAKSDSLL